MHKDLKSKSINELLDILYELISKNIIEQDQQMDLTLNLKALNMTEERNRSNLRDKFSSRKKNVSFLTKSLNMGS
jgi:predicted RNA-binding protein with RPS1 domain